MLWLQDNWFDIENYISGHFPAWKDISESSQTALVDNFLRQILKRPPRSNAPLDLLCINREKLVMNTAADGSLPCNDHRVTEFRISRKDTKLNSRVRILNFRRWDFSLFNQLLVRFAKEAIIRKKGTQESWLFFGVFFKKIYLDLKS